MTDSTGIFIGASVTGTGIPLGAVVSAIAGNSVTLNVNATVTGSQTIDYEVTEMKIIVDFVTARQKMYGTVQNFYLDAQGSYVTLQYVNSTIGWVIN